MSLFTKAYPWITSPLIVSAPMRQLSLPPLAVAVSSAGGLGFIGGGSDFHKLDDWLGQARDLVSQSAHLQRFASDILPVGLGLFMWAPESDLQKAVKVVARHRIAAIWMFGAHENSDYAKWAEMFKSACPRTEVWVQVGRVDDAVEVSTLCGKHLDVLVVQGTDAGGHGLERGAGIITLLPEVRDALDIRLVAAGGIVDGRGVAAALTLGADAVCLGTRFLASEEATITKGYQREVVRATDGGFNTARTRAYDQLRGTTDWPTRYNARGVLNQSYYDHIAGVSFAENQRLHDEALRTGDAGWGVHGRVTTYAGTGVGLIRSVKKAEGIVHELQTDAARILRATSARL